MQDVDTGLERQLVDEFKRLRSGPGLAAAALADRLGPRLAGLADVPPGAPRREIHRRLVGLLERLMRGLIDEDALAVRTALGLEPGAKLSQLTDRTNALAERLRCENRTARRRIALAFGHLAHTAAAELRWQEDPTAFRSTGWHVRRFDASLRLDRDGPELVERRAIVARVDGLRRIEARFSVLKLGEEPLGPADLAVEATFGTELVSLEQLSEAQFRLQLELSRTLARDEEHEYELEFRLGAGRRIQPHYAFVPMVDCERFDLRVRFDRGRPPTAVLRLDGVPYREFDGRFHPGQRITLDAHGQAALRFEGLDRGLMYGIEWVPGDRN
jgi:hypothetical protein